MLYKPKNANLIMEILSRGEITEGQEVQFENPEFRPANAWNTIGAIDYPNSGVYGYPWISIIYDDYIIVSIYARREDIEKASARQIIDLIHEEEDAYFALMWINLKAIIAGMRTTVAFSAYQNITFPKRTKAEISQWNRGSNIKPEKFENLRKYFRMTKQNEMLAIKEMMDNTKPEWIDEKFIKCRNPYKSKDETSQDQQLPEASIPDTPW